MGKKKKQPDAWDIDADTAPVADPTAPAPAAPAPAAPAPAAPAPAAPAPAPEQVQAVPEAARTITPPAPAAPAPAAASIPGLENIDAEKVQAQLGHAMQTGDASGLMPLVTSVFRGLMEAAPPEQRAQIEQYMNQSGVPVVNGVPDAEALTKAAGSILQNTARDVEAVPPPQAPTPQVLDGVSELNHYDRTNLQNFVAQIGKEYQAAPVSVVFMLDRWRDSMSFLLYRQERTPTGGTATYKTDEFRTLEFLGDIIAPFLLLIPHPMGVVVFSAARGPVSWLSWARLQKAATLIKNNVRTMLVEPPPAPTAPAPAAPAPAPAPAAPKPYTGGPL